MGNPAEETWRHRDVRNLASPRNPARQFYFHFLPFFTQELAATVRPRFASDTGTEAAPASAKPARSHTNFPWLSAECAAAVFPFP